LIASVPGELEYGKTLFQILIGSNGLAATALLTLAGALKQASLARALAIPILFYLVGVVFGTHGAIELFRSKGRYDYRWQLRFFGESAEAEERERRDAHRLRS
jgi:hypothetical protein